MAIQRRWMKWVFEEADAPHVAMPWERRRQNGWKNRSDVSTLTRTPISA